MCKIVETIFIRELSNSSPAYVLEPSQVREFGYVLHYKSLSVKSIQDFLSFVISNFTDKVVKFDVSYFSKVIGLFWGLN